MVVCFRTRHLALPPPRALPGTSAVIPFVFVGDEAFPLRTNLMKTYPRRYLPESEAVFNYIILIKQSQKSY